MDVGDIVQVTSKVRLPPGSYGSSLAGKVGILAQLWVRQYGMAWRVLFMDGTEAWIDDYDLTTLPPGDTL